MKRFIGIFVAAALFMAAKPALAFETKTEDPAQRTLLQVMGQAFQPAAARLGAPVLVAADYSDPEHRSALLEYLPEGAPLDAWTRMVSVAVYNLEEDPKEQQMTMVAVAGGLFKAFVTHGKILQVQHYMNDLSEPGMFVEFEIGEGKAKEHNAGVFMRTSRRAAAFVQLQSRGRPLTADEVLNVHKMIARDPKPGKPPTAEALQKLTAPQMPAAPQVPAMPQPPKLDPKSFFESLKGTGPEPILIPDPDDPSGAVPDKAAPPSAATDETMDEDIIPPGIFDEEPEWRREAAPAPNPAPANPSPAKPWLERN